LDQRRSLSVSADGLPSFKQHAKWRAEKSIFEINTIIDIAQSLSGSQCCHFWHQRQNRAVSLCIAQK
jgi:hypothetical protein